MSFKSKKEIVKYAKNYYLLHKDTIKKRSKQWRLNNYKRWKTAHRINQRRWVLKNKEKVKRISRKSRLKNIKKRIQGTKDWRNKNKKWVKTYDRNYQLRKLYGITEKDYQLLLKKQKGKCTICGALPKTRKLNVDHDHNTGVIRGLLCPKCNVNFEWFIRNRKKILNYFIKNK